MFNDQFGLLNYFLSWFDINKIAWLKEEKWTIPTNGDLPCGLAKYRPLLL